MYKCEKMHLLCDLSFIAIDDQPFCDIIFVAVGKVAVGSIAMASALKTSLIMTPPPGHMTREELERHLEAKQNTNPQFLSIEKTPHSLPDDIFSHDNSNPDRYVF